MTSGDDKINVKDGLLVYDYEGQDSPVGSIGSCSQLESKDDLHFLDDLGPKFKTLAEICGSTKIQTEKKHVVSPLPNVSATKIQASESYLLATPPMSLPPKLPSPDKTNHIVMSETTKQSETMKESMTTVKEEMSSVKQGMGNQNHMFLVQQQQQPVYYTTAPMMQPMHYVVQPAFQNAMVLAEAPATNLQNMVLVTNTDTGSSPGFLVQGQTMMSSPQAQSLSPMLKSSGICGSYNNLIHSGHLSGSQTMMVVDSKFPAGSMKIINGSQAGLIRGRAISTGELSGSQSYLIVGEPTNGKRQQVQEAKGDLQKNEVSASQKIYNRKGNKSSGSHNSASSKAVKTTSTIHNTVVQNTKEVH